MNLIEQFGYEAVKAELKDKKWRRDNLHGSAEFTWHIEQHIQLLEAILLEHRRQHNIFEIGDLYVFTEKYSKQSVIHKVDSLNGGKGCIRHATNEEIKAGRRL